MFPIVTSGIIKMKLNIVILGEKTEYDIKGIEEASNGELFQLLAIMDIIKLRIQQDFFMGEEK